MNVALAAARRAEWIAAQEKFQAVQSVIAMTAMYGELPTEYLRAEYAERRDAEHAAWNTYMNEAGYPE